MENSGKINVFGGGGKQGAHKYITARKTGGAGRTPPVFCVPPTPQIVGKRAAYFLSRYREEAGTLRGGDVGYFVRKRFYVDFAKRCETAYIRRME